MEVKLAALADFASLSREGKLSLLGIFDRVNPPSLPYTHPNMYLVIIFDASPAEAGLTREVRVTLLDANGNSILSLGQEIVIPQPHRPGARIRINQLLALAGLKFTKAGDYQFSILVGDDEKDTVSLVVNEPRQATSEES